MIDEAALITMREAITHMSNVVVDASNEDAVVEIAEVLNDVCAERKFCDIIMAIVTLTECVLRSLEDTRAKDVVIATIANLTHNACDRETRH